MTEIVKHTHSTPERIPLFFELRSTNLHTISLIIMSTTTGYTIPVESASKDKRTLKTCDSYDSEDADVELISSDNVLFKVHSYRLQYAS